MDDDARLPEPRDITHLFLKVVEIGEAINWIAHGNFAGSCLGPRALLEFRGSGSSLETLGSEGSGKDQLAFELLWARAEAGVGRKAILARDAHSPAEDGHWGEPAEEPEPIPRYIIAVASWTEDEGGGMEADESSYWSVTVHHDDLIKWFPMRPACGRERAANALRAGLFEAGHSRVTPQGRALASTESKCRQWIAELAAQRVTPHSWNDLFSQALAKFPLGLSRRGFDRCWDNAAPDEWKRAGRKSRRD